MTFLKTARATQGAVVSNLILALFGCMPVSAQNVHLLNGENYITSTDLPRELVAALQRLGGRMMSADKAQVVVAGTVTDADGSRAAQLIVQAPGYLSYREGLARAVTFDGLRVQGKLGQPTFDEEKLFESLVANFPDSIYLQVATGGSVRRLGSHFRTDDGTTKGYAGPYWTVFAFSPGNRPGLTRGKSLQQELFIAVDEQTGFISNVRNAMTTESKQQSVTETQFSNWTQFGAQWFPSTITRLENGRQVLSFQTQQAAVVPAADIAIFKP